MIPLRITCESAAQCDRIAELQYALITDALLATVVLTVVIVLLHAAGVRS